MSLTHAPARLPDASRECSSARDERLHVLLKVLAVAACVVFSSGPLPRLAERQRADRTPSGGAHAAGLKRGVGREATHSGRRQSHTNVEHLDERQAVVAHLALLVDVLGGNAVVVLLILELVQQDRPPGAGRLPPRRELRKPLIEEHLDLSPDQLMGGGQRANTLIWRARGKCGVTVGS